MNGNPAKRLGELIADIVPCEVRGGGDCIVTSLQIDSRKVRDGALFVALRGEHVDGHLFIDAAVAAGARAVVMEREQLLPSNVTGIVVPDSARALSLLANSLFGRPSQSLRAIGITGTNGKTTTAHFIAAILSEGGIPTGVLGTLGARFADQRWKIENTTPLAHELHQILAQMRDAGANAVAMEVSSHALALQRVEDVRFSIGVLTNITRDHLDFHGTFGNYVSVKRRLFERADTLILNVDDAIGAQWSREFREHKRVLTYGLCAEADIRALHARFHEQYTDFQIGAQEFRLHLPGRFNVANALAAVALARTFGIQDGISARGLRTIDSLPGRMQRQECEGISVIVDYAHTPDALANLLSAVRETTLGKVLVVFGCGGDRDAGKRALMGSIAAENADRIFVTSDNPRSEDPQKIVDQIAEGIPARDARNIHIDRREAIVAAIEAAQGGDTVVIAGKGHERYQVYAERTEHFDDMQEARDALQCRQRH